MATRLDGHTHLDDGALRDEIEALLLFGIVEVVPCTGVHLLLLVLVFLLVVISSDWLIFVAVA